MNLVSEIPDNIRINRLGLTQPVSRQFNDREGILEIVGYDREHVIANLEGAVSFIKKACVFDRKRCQPCKRFSEAKILRSVRPGWRRGCQGYDSQQLSMGQQRHGQEGLDVCAAQGSK